MTDRLDLLRVRADDPAYRQAAAAEAEYWSQPHPFGLESIEKHCGPSPVDEYQNQRFTGDRRVAWYESLARYGTFQRGLALGTSALRMEGAILESNPTLHLTFLDISPGAVERRAEILGKRFPGRVATAVADLNFAVFAPEAYDFVVSSSSLHHVTNLEHLAWQINRTLTPTGRFFLQDYVGEQRFQFHPEKRRVFERIHDAMMVPQGRPPGMLWRDVSDLSPFCGVRSDEVLSALATQLVEVERRTAETLTVALLRAYPTDGAVPDPPGRGARLYDALKGWGYRLRGELPPGKVPIPPELLQQLILVGDVCADAGVLLPGTAFAIYRKR